MTLRSTAASSKTVKIDVHTEQVVLAAMLVDADTRTRLVRAIPPERWQVPQHRAAVVALQELERRHVAYDPAAMKRLFPEVDIEYLGQLVEARPEVPQDLAHYVEGVRWDSLRAEAVRGPIAALLEALADPLTEPAKAKGLARGVASAFDAWKERARILDPEDVLDRMEAALRSRADGHGVFPFGLKGLDTYEDEGAASHHPGGNLGKARLIPAAKPGKVTVITGTSGGGKSTIACRIALGQARLRRKVLFGAWEMDAEESTELLAVMSLSEEGVPISRVRLQEGETEEVIQMVKARARIISKYVRFVPNPFQRAGNETNAGNLDIIEHLIEETGADVIICDLWERCLVDDEPSEIMRALFRQQTICEATKCHGILLQQQRLKDVEMRADKRPTREGIKGTSAWVEISDTILGVYRPAQWKAVPDDILVVDILKQRYGPWPLSVELEWSPDRAWFGKGTSVPYDQPSGREGQSELDAFTGPSGGKRRRHHG